MKFFQKTSILQHWTTCLLPDYSCAKVHVPAVGHLFACLPDFGDIQPAFFYYFEPKKVHKVTLENYFSLSKYVRNRGEIKMFPCFSEDVIR